MPAIRRIAIVGLSNNMALSWKLKVLHKWHQRRLISFMVPMMLFRSLTWWTHLSFIRWGFLNITSLTRVFCVTITNMSMTCPCAFKCHKRTYPSWEWINILHVPEPKYNTSKRSDKKIVCMYMDNENGSKYRPIITYIMSIFNKTKSPWCLRCIW